MSMQNGNPIYKRVMIIDDTYVDRYVAERNLLKYGISEEVVSKESAKAALQYLQSCESDTNLLPQLIFLDIRMPEMDGFEVLQSLLGTAGTLNIPFVFSSCRSEKSDHTEALNMGADDYITKPYELEELVHKIEGLLCTGSVRHH